MTVAAAGTSLGAPRLARGLSTTYHPGSQVWVPVVEAAAGSQLTNGAAKKKVAHWRRGVVEVRVLGRALERRREVVGERLAAWGCAIDRSAVLPHCYCIWHQARTCSLIHSSRSRAQRLPRSPPRCCPQAVHKQPDGEPLLDVRTEEGQQVDGLPASDCFLQVMIARGRAAAARACGGRPGGARCVVAPARRLCLSCLLTTLSTLSCPTTSSSLRPPARTSATTPWTTWSSRTFCTNRGEAFGGLRLAAGPWRLCNGSGAGRMRAGRWSSGCVAGADAAPCMPAVVVRCQRAGATHASRRHRRCPPRRLLPPLPAASCTPCACATPWTPSTPTAGTS